MSPDQPEPAPSRRGLRIAGIVGGVVAAFIVVTGVASRESGDAQLRDWTEKQAIPTVAVAPPDTQGRSATLDLPGRLEAYYQAPIFARVSGYIKDWKVDIGTPVKAGQLLADIEAPDLDQQLVQARADLASAVANAKLSDVTLKRGQTLLKSHWVSQQDVDTQTADLGNKQGLVDSAQANVDRLRVLEQYKRITAPFDGLVTARTTDVGALINAGAGTGAALFVVSDTSKLRLYINVPQNYAPSIATGAKAQITVPEYPGRSFPAVVEALSQAVDIASGTTRVQLSIDNARHELMPGDFANVRLDLPHPAVALNIPASALIFDQSGLRVATVGMGDRVTLKTVTIARDLGDAIEIASGLAPDDRVIASPPDGLATGDQVHIAGDVKNDAMPATASAKP